MEVVCAVAVRVVRAGRPGPRDLDAGCVGIVDDDGNELVRRRRRRPCYDKIYRYVYFKMNDQTVAEDITQETFLRFISQKGSIHGYEIKYLYTIARNLCVDEYRRVKPDSLPEGYEEIIPARDDLLEERIAIRDVVAKLPIEDQELLLLRYVNNESVGTISKTLGISRFALYRRLKNAEDKLRAGLEVNIHEK